jgi:hypothetical protein
MKKFGFLLVFDFFLNVNARSLEYLKFFGDFHYCKSTSTIIQIDDDDDINFNTLQLYKQKEDEYHLINLKNNVNIFVYSYGQNLYESKCTMINMIIIPNMIKECYRYLAVTYYEDGNPEQKHGFLQKNLIIRNDEQKIAIEQCKNRSNIYTIGNDIIIQKGNIDQGTSVNFDKKKDTSFISLKTMSEVKDYFYKIDNNRIYKIYSLIENIIVPFLIILTIIKYIFNRYQTNTIIENENDSSITEDQNTAFHTISN